MLREVTELCTVSISELGGAVDTVLQSDGLQMDDIPGLCELLSVVLHIAVHSMVEIRTTISYD